MKKLLSAAPLLVCLLSRRLPAGEPPPLTLEWLFRDPKWIGAMEDELRWTSDSSRVIFKWNPEGRPVVPTYTVGEDGEAREDPAAIAAPARDDAAWDPELRRRAYERDGDVYLEEPGESGAPPRTRRLTETRAAETRPQFALGGKLLSFERDGNLFALSLDGGGVVQLTDFRAEDPPRPAAGGEKGGPLPDFYPAHEAELLEVVRRRVQRQRERTESEAALAALPGRPAPHLVGKGRPEEPSLSPDGRFVVFRLRLTEPRPRSPRVAVLITETGDTGEVEAGSRALSASDRFRLGVVDLRPPAGSPSVRWVDTASIPGIDDAVLAEVRKENGLPPGPAARREVAFHRARWIPGERRALLQCYSLDFKDRWILLLDPGSGRLEPVDRQHDGAWVGGPGAGTLNTPGGAGWLEPGLVWFVSEASGFAHLHARRMEEGKEAGGRSALTSGSFEVHDPFLSTDRKWLYFHSNEGDPAERHFYRVPAAGGPRQRLTDRPGWNEAVLSPDGARIAFQSSRVGVPPEVYLKPCDPQASSRRVTRTASEEFLSRRWIVPERVWIPARDGARVPGRFFPPAGRTAAGGPAVVFVHGAGYLQEIRDAWPFYFREYLFHNLLASRGCAVLEVDYRGSAGYGRDWRTGIFRHMGGRDLEDHLDAARWLVEERGVDPARIGIYGGSYGGFIVFMALFRAPEVFACGAALRPVADWSQYHHDYVARILHTPDVDPLAYKRSSPIHFAEGLERPLLICHGLADTNVRFQDTARLTQRLIELGKTGFEVAIYPAEGHAFQEPSSWLDEYRRILRLFETHLRLPRRRAGF